MRKYLFALAAALALLPAAAYAQTFTKTPVFAQNQQWVDVGNGPLELLAIEGNGEVFSSGGTGVGTSAGTTAFTLTGTPAATITPCVGCAIGCFATAGAPCSIPAGTTITAFNGTTGITTNNNTTVTAGTVLWGVACPASTAANVPGVNPNTVASLGQPGLTLRSSGSAVQSAWPMNTTSRLCLYGGLQAGVIALPFPIGAH